MCSGDARSGAWIRPQPKGSRGSNRSAEKRAPNRERDVSRRKPFLTALLASSVLAGLVAAASAEDLVTEDHAGKTDAANTLTVRLNPTQSPSSPHAEQGAAYKKIW